MKSFSSLKDSALKTLENKWGQFVAITRSSELMNGHKWEFFLFSLSFIGWFLLSILTLGIGFLWSTPYYMSAKSAYYHGLLEDEANKEPYGQDDYVKVMPTE